jgi:hypothetical protein
MERPKNARARCIDQYAGQIYTLRGHVEAIWLGRWNTSNVWVTGDPGWKIAPLRHIDASFDLQPAEDDVQCGCIGNVAVATIVLLHLLKPPKKEKQVARADAAPLQVAFCDPGLSKQWLPTGQSHHALCIKVGIEMCRRVGPDPTVGEILDDWAK